MRNPFSLSFGKKPMSLIDRDLMSNEIIESFQSENPNYQVCMISGIRGSGKTVAMTSIAQAFAKNKEWIVADLNPESELIEDLAGQLANHPDLLMLFQQAKIDLSFLGLGIHIDGASPIMTINSALDRMLDRMTKKGKSLLITIDEVVSSKEIRKFTSQFQIYMRKGYRVFLLMTGLYENLDKLQNEKTQTFLYRAPKYILDPLHVDLIRQEYQKIFDLDMREAYEMAKITQGYSFAYQVLGYYTWKNKNTFSQNLDQFDQTLSEYVYEKIWSETSAQAKKILIGMAQTKSNSVKAIRETVGMNSSLFSSYRARLLKRQIIYSPQYGSLAFTLPRFKEFVLLQAFLTSLDE